ncbi:RDD family protein [Phycicoccus sp. CSK15P-2]|uniref:RDD family protein n=1 Tax=Phycicoccus sp. CSK15P-2 TaxID=2807627 RepID=UPI00194E6275|nr:RDD family protein [Phycicoccus sp. CSK15P-2]MBM6403158.1 RDD family protein [Phycicoccus sp. CSK15P-2]
MSHPPEPPRPPEGTPPPTPYPGAAPQHNPYGGIPQQNPYGAAPAPPQAGYAPPVGSLGYVEANFGPVAQFGDRVLALLIDSAIQLIGLVPMFVGAGLLGVGAPSDPYEEVNTPLAVAGLVLMLVGVLAMVAIGLWNRVFRMGRTGRSIGKEKMGLILVDARSGQPIGAGTCFLRELMSSIINQVFYLSYLWMLWDPNRVTLADMVVTSTVVKRPVS